MSSVIKFSCVEDKIITVRGQKVILDSDVATLYGVETKRVNEAVNNNPDKFPEGYLLKVSKVEKKELVENFDRFNRLKHCVTINYYWNNFFACSLSTQTLQKINRKSKNSANTDLSQHKETKFYNELLVKRKNNNNISQYENK